MRFCGFSCNIYHYNIYHLSFIIYHYYLLLSLLFTSMFAFHKETYKLILLKMAVQKFSARFTSSTLVFLECGKIKTTSLLVGLRRNIRNFRKIRLWRRFEDFQGSELLLRRRVRWRPLLFQQVVPLLAFKLLFAHRWLWIVLVLGCPIELHEPSVSKKTFLTFLFAIHRELTI